MCLGERRPGGEGGGLAEGRGGFFGLLNFLTHIVRKPWCIRGY